MKFAFFGTPDIARIVLDELATANLTPSLVVTNPDAPVGRKQILTPPPVKIWAEEHGVKVIQPTNLKDKTLVPELMENRWDVFVVVAYGKIIPQWLLDIPKYGTLNVHPSLLPKLRGASPIRSAILQDVRETGVTIMLLDALMDHGPILLQEKTHISENEWPIKGNELDKRLAHQGGRLLSIALPQFVAGQLNPKVQDHEAATFCTKISKDMSELIINPAQLPHGEVAREYLRKVCAFAGWPETFFMDQGKRVKIKDARIIEDVFYPTNVIPEGKKEMGWNTYIKRP